jgi:hypothetical protein
MKLFKGLSIILISCLSMMNLLHAQEERGYYDASYTRYQADQGVLTNANILSVSFSQKDLQSKAFEQVCAYLSGNEASVEWIVKKEGDGIVVRYSVPDETFATMDVYVNGKLVGTLNLTSYWSWEYLATDGNPNNIYVRNNIPKKRFDEVRLRLLTNPIGAKLKLASKTGRVHRDFVELELVPEAIKPDPSDLVYAGDGSDLQIFIDNNGGSPYLFLKVFIT